VFAAHHVGTLSTGAYLAANVKPSARVVGLVPVCIFNDSVGSTDFSCLSAVWPQASPDQIMPTSGCSTHNSLHFFTRGPGHLLRLNPRARLSPAFCFVGSSSRFLNSSET
jgi:hypothetical protein